MAKRDTRETLLDVAEVLFAEHGVEGVSLRTINTKAGVSPGVLHYHFGHREALVEALILRRIGQLMEDRRQRFEELEGRAQDPSVNQVAEALVRPLARMVLEEGPAGRRYVKFYARLYSDRSETLWKMTSVYFDEAILPFEGLIQRACPELGLEDINLRFTAAVHTMAQTLADIGSPPRPWQDSLTEDRRDPEALVESLIEFIAGGLAAPSRSSK